MWVPGGVPPWGGYRWWVLYGVWYPGVVYWSGSLLCALLTVFSLARDRLCRAHSCPGGPSMPDHGPLAVFSEAMMKPHLG